MGFHGRRHPRELAAAEVAQFLTDPAVRWPVASTTQNEAWSAVLLLFGEVLRMDLPAISTSAAQVANCGHSRPMPGIHPPSMTSQCAPEMSHIQTNY